MIAQTRRSLLLTMALAATALAGCQTGSPPPTAVVPATTPGPSPMTESGKIKVALLLPLSGRAANLGQAMQEAAELALFEGAGRTIALSTFDTGDTPEGAVDAFNKAQREGTALILGPLFGASASRLAPMVRQANLNMISFSNDEQVAQPGTWIMGIAAAPQVRRVADYAIGRGIRSFAVLAPQSPYGQQTAKVLEDHLASRSASVISRQFFDPGSADIANDVRKLAADIITKQGAALFLPVGGQPLPMVLSTLQANQLDSRQIQYVGTGVWDSLEVWQLGNLNGAWYAAPDPAQRAEFDRKFTATYGKPAPRLATLAYDAVRFAGALSIRRPGGDFSAAAITHSAGFSGADGAFRFLADGRVERMLAVMEVSGQRVNVVAPAPTSFDRVAF